jgi:hypothetical protein
LVDGDDRAGRRAATHRWFEPSRRHRLSMLAFIGMEQPGSAAVFAFSG